MHFRTMTTLFLCWAFFQFDAAGASLGAPAIGPGSSIVIRAEGSGAVPWTIRVTHAEQETLFGVAEQPISRAELGYWFTPELISAELRGDNNGMTVTLYRFDLLQDQPVSVRQWRGRVENAKWVFAPFPEQKNLLGEPVVCAVGIKEENSESDARKLWDEFLRKQAAAKKEWITLRPDWERLKQRGHLLSDPSIDCSGAISWIWTEKYRDWRTMPKKTLTDYSLLVDLAEFERIPSMSFTNRLPPGTTPLLRNLKQVGKLTIEESYGLDLSTLANGPSIKALALHAADQRTIDSLQPVRGLEALRIGLNRLSGPAPKTIDLSPLNRLTSLKHLEVLSLPLEAKGVASTLTELRELQSLTLLTSLDRSSLTALQKLPALESLEAGIASAPDLALITQPRLKRLRSSCFSYSPPMSDEILLTWQIPRSLTDVELSGFWTPEPLISYCKHLPKMDEVERDIYENVRALPQMKKNREYLDAARRRAIVIGGIWASNEDGPNVGVAKSRTRLLLKEINDTRIQLDAFIPKTAKLTLLATKARVDNKTMSEANAMAVFQALGPYLDQADPDVWEIVRPPESRRRNVKADEIVRAAVAAMGDVSPLQAKAGLRMEWEVKYGSNDRTPERWEQIMVPSKCQLLRTGHRYDFFKRREVPISQVISDGKLRVALVHGEVTEQSQKCDIDFLWGKQHFVPLMLTGLLSDLWQLEVAKARDFEGKAVDAIRVFSHGAQYAELLFDRQSKLLLHRIEKPAASHSLAFPETAQNGDYRWWYKSYKQMGDFVVPSLVDLYDPIGNWHVLTTLRTVELLGEVPDDRFKVPVATAR